MERSKYELWEAKDCALIFIDYQPEMFKWLRSSDPELVEMNACMLARTARAFDIPVVLSTVGVDMGVNHPTVDSLKRELPGVTEIDRSTMNAWKDANFLQAVKAMGRNKLVFCALWTEICLAYPVVEALKDGYEVMIVTDAVGGESLVEHEMAIYRMIQAGAVPNTTTATICEWFQDWKSPLANKIREDLRPYLTKKRDMLMGAHGAMKENQAPSQTRAH